MGYYFLSRKRKGEEQGDQKRGVGREGGWKKKPNAQIQKTLDPVSLSPSKIFSVHLKKIVSKYVFATTVPNVALSHCFFLGRIVGK